MRITTSFTSNVNESKVIARLRDVASGDGVNALTTIIDSSMVGFDSAFNAGPDGREIIISGTSTITVFFGSRAWSFLINDKYARRIVNVKQITPAIPARRKKPESRNKNIQWIQF